MQRIVAIVTLTVSVASFIAGCAMKARNRPPTSQQSAAKTGAQQEQAMTITVSSAAFANGKPIPKKYAGEGQDVLSALSWSNLPAGTKQLALVCDDPDAPVKEPWVHWVIYNISPDVSGLPEGLPADASLKQPAGALQGEKFMDQRADDRISRADASAGPRNASLPFQNLRTRSRTGARAPGASKADLLSAMKGHQLAARRTHRHVRAVRALLSRPR